MAADKITSEGSSIVPVPAISIDNFPKSIVCEKLNGATNYLTWSHAVRIFLIGRQLESYITDPPPDSKSPMYSQWRAADANVMSWLWHSLEPSVFRTVSLCNTSKAIWDSLADSFSQRSNISEIFEAYEQLFSFRQGDRSLSDYYSTLKALGDRLLQLRPFPDTKAEMIRQWDELMTVLLLAGLNDNLRSYRDQFLAGETIPPLASAYSRLQRSSLGHHHSTSSTPSGSDSAALVTGSGGSRGGFRGGGRGSRGGSRGSGRGSGRGNKKCDHCGGTNHTEPYCWKKYGRPDQAHHVTVNTSSSEVVSSSTTSGSSDPVNSGAVSQGPFSSAELDAIVQALRNSHSSSSTATLAHSGNSACLSTSSAPQWILDSGASAHVSGNPSLFSDLTTTTHCLTLADGSSRSVAGKGHLKPSTSLSLPSSLYVPNFPFNLLSVSQLTRLLNCSITFSPSSCVFQDLRTQRMIGSGCERDGLYYLDPASFSSSHSVFHVSDSPLQWHCRLGHPSLSRLKLAVPDLSSVSSLECEACQLGKHHRSSFPVSSHGRESKPFSVVHTDIWGPSRVSTINGYCYFVIFVDDFSRMTWLFLMKSRSELPNIVLRFYNEILTQFDTRIKILRSDNALEYTKSVMEKFCVDRGIIHQTSCVHTSQQNGVAERKHRHLLDVARTLQIHMNVPKSYWGDAVLTACYLINRVPSVTLGNRSSFSLLYPSANPFALPLRTFGCTAFVHNLDPGLDKLSPRARRCIFLGYSRTQKGYRCYHPSSRRSFVSADVTFFESTPYFQVQGELSSREGEFSSSSQEGETSTSISSPVLPIPNMPLQVYQRRARPAPITAAPVDPAPEISTPETEPLAINDLDLPIAQRRGKRTCTQYPIAKFVSYHRILPRFQSFVCAMSSISVPTSYNQALLSPNWKKAMDEEMQALHHNQTWELTSLPKGKNTVGCRWVYTIKYQPDGSIERLKARLVAKGYTQTYGVDYLETFSPVARLNSVRILLAVAVCKSWPLFQLDIKNAFLHGELQEEVYMDQPPGYTAMGDEHLVCRLRKALYGLKQSPRAWFDRFSSALLKYGFKRSTSDHSVFVHQSPSGTIILIVYVDDIIISGDDDKGISKLKSYLGKQFHTKDLGVLRYFLGIEIARSSKGISLSQRKYVLDLLSETGLLGSRPVDTPMDCSLRLDNESGDPFPDVGRYRRLVGKLIYLTVTRPDITYAVGVVSQFMHAPRKPHFEAVCRILRYLKNSPGKGLLYRASTTMDVIGYSDADWAGSHSDRRSTSGYCTFIGGNLVTWRSKKQTVVARSSAEAEYRAMAHTASEMLWVRSLLRDFGINIAAPMSMFCDNQAAIFIANNPVFHERTKHIEVDCHFIRDLLVKRDIVTPFVRSDSQLGDILTKPLASSPFQKMSSKLGMFDLYGPA